MLRPRESETRQLKDLCGLWKFCAAEDGQGEAGNWPDDGLPAFQFMPFPSSVNDLTQDLSLRDHLGPIWYERDDFVPVEWQDRDVELWVGAATHRAKVWVNGELIAEHNGGFLPFAGNANEALRFGGRNRIVIRVDTRLDWATLPPGMVADRKGRECLPEDWEANEFHFDFMNYVGIHRPVRWVVTPKSGLKELSLTPDLEEGDGILTWELTHGGDRAVVSVVAEDGHLLAEGEGENGRLRVAGIVPWAPLKPSLYDVSVQIITDDTVVDRYSLRTGFRNVHIEGKQFLINGEPFYFKGYGRHEDAPLRGRGLDLVHQIKDVNLLLWTGANSFRTSHYPYAEECMDLADELGIVVIDEVPAVGLGIWGNWGKDNVVFNDELAGPELCEHHCQVVRDLIHRDRHHPCVVSWSLGNESATYETGSRPYYEKVVAASRAEDSSRPHMYVINVPAEQDRVGDLFDFLGLNAYKSWYDLPGRLDSIQHTLPSEILPYWEKYKLPIMLTEYGTDTIAGFHQDPPVMFTEEYQVAFFDEYHKVMDEFDFVVGEQVWNFADFMTKQGLTRVDGNRKGVFTRDRRPKMGAHALRARWTSHHPKWG